MAIALYGDRLFLFRERWDYAAILNDFDTEGINR